jgi:hypothetical protein
MSQNDWATIMPFGPVTNFLLAQKFQALIMNNHTKFISNWQSDFREED